MEDLKEQGFRMAERISGLDMNHCLLVMRQLGRYHAASAVLHEKEPEHFRHFLDSLFTINLTESTERLFKTNILNLVKEVGKWPDYKERFYEKLLKIADNVCTYFVDSLRRDEEEFNVLCHGDLWLNNMMFRYSEDTGEVMNIR
jgi:thiamine kinase-like enzyme